MKNFVFTTVVQFITGVAFLINILSFLFKGEALISWYIPIGLAALSFVSIVSLISTINSE